MRSSARGWRSCWPRTGTSTSSRQRPTGRRRSPRSPNTGPTALVVALTSFSAAPQVLGALDAGAVGYLLKDAAPDELRNGVRAAARGESPLDPKAATTVLSARAERRTGGAEELSPRE